MLPQLIKLLRKEGIDLVFSQNAEGVVYSITYVTTPQNLFLTGVPVVKNRVLKTLTINVL